MSSDPTTPGALAHASNDPPHVPGSDAQDDGASERAASAESTGRELQAAGTPLAPRSEPAMSESVLSESVTSEPAVAETLTTEAPAADHPAAPGRTDGTAELTGETPTIGWAEQPTDAEPPTWSGQPTYAQPSYAPSEYTPPEYIPPDYSSPVAPHVAQAKGYPEYIAPTYVAPAYAAPAYPPPPTSSPRLRWPAVILTVAALAVVVALSLVLAGAAFKGFGKTTGPSTLYSSSMTSATSDWPTDQECSFQHDGYHITSATNCYYSAAVYQDATVTVTAKLVSGDVTGAYGIAFRRPGPNRYYVFLVTGDGNWLVARDNVAVVRSQHNSAIKTGVGATNKLAVRMQGGHFTFFVNGTQLGDLTDNTYASGNVGLAGDSNIDVAFRNFSVTQP